MKQVLDHGYVSLVETWGSDELIVEAARMSTGKGFMGWGEGPCPVCDQAGRLDPKDKLFLNHEKKREALGLREFGAAGIVKACHHCNGTGKAVGDEKLLRYLWEHKHATPFEITGMTIEVQAPIMVFREWHRHRTQSYNEMSARYAPLPDVNYIPTVERLMLSSKTNKQAGTIKGSKELTEDAAEQFRFGLREIYRHAEEMYQSALRNGVPKELARIHLPVGRYSRMMASANLRNWLAFLTLRMAPEAQWEIRQYANAVGEMIRDAFPRTWGLFVPA